MSDGYYQQVDEDRYGFDSYEDHTRYPKDDVSEDTYYEAKRAKTGTHIVCPTCKKQFQKTSYQQAFCSNKGRKNCKDKFWNRVDEERASRALKYSNK